MLTSCLTSDEGDAQEASGRLFLRNLPFTTTEAELSDAFADFGDLQEVHLVLDRYPFHDTISHKHLTCDLYYQTMDTLFVFSFLKEGW